MLSPVTSDDTAKVVQLYVCRVDFDTHGLNSETLVPLRRSHCARQGPRDITTAPERKISWDRLVQVPNEQIEKSRVGNLA